MQFTPEYELIYVVHRGSANEDKHQEDHVGRKSQGTLIMFLVAALLFSAARLFVLLNILTWHPSFLASTWSGKLDLIHANAQAKMSWLNRTHSFRTKCLATSARLISMTESPLSLQELVRGMSIMWVTSIQINVQYRAYSPCSTSTSDSDIPPSQLHNCSHPLWYYR